MMLLPILPATLPASAPVVRTQAVAAPDGWSPVTMKDGQLGFRPDDVPAGKTVGIILWPEESAPGDLKAWFTKRAAAMGAKGGQFQEAGGVVLTSGRNASKPFILAAVRPGGATSRARVGMLFGDADMIRRYNPGFSEVIRSLRGGGAGATKSTGSTSTTKSGSGARPSRDQQEWAGLPASDPAKPLPAAAMNGAKIFIVYTNTYGMSGMEVNTEPLILFPGGVAFDGAPDKPVAAFDAARLKPAYRPADVGRWSMTGAKMTLTWPARTREKTVVYRKVGTGWTSDPKKKASDAWDVYRPVVPVTRAKMQGAWETKSLVTMGTMGGGTPMVAAGSNGDLAFRGDRYSDATTSFASSTTANMGDAFKSGGDVGAYSKGKNAGAGRYRLDGLLLTRERYGKRGIEPVFLLPNWDGGKMGTMMIGDRRYERPEK